MKEAKAKRYWKVLKKQECQAEFFNEYANGCGFSDLP